MMIKVPLQCERMAETALEYCELIDGFSGVSQDQAWLQRMDKLLPRLHVAVIALSMPCERYHGYRFPDDDARVELYMRLHHVLHSDVSIWTSWEILNLRHQLCDRLADDFTDVYFDLKGGLEVFEDDHLLAMKNWLCSFYMHWGRHLLDAEYWLRTLGGSVAVRPLQA
jgi:hypothetical protein